MNEDLVGTLVDKLDKVEAVVVEYAPNVWQALLIDAQVEAWTGFSIWLLLVAICSLTLRKCWQKAEWSFGDPDNSWAGAVVIATIMAAILVLAVFIEAKETIMQFFYPEQYVITELLYEVL